MIIDRVTENFGAIDPLIRSLSKAILRKIIDRGLGLNMLNYF